MLEPSPSLGGARDGEDDSAEAPAALIVMIVLLGAGCGRCGKSGGGEHCGEGDAGTGKMV